MKKLMLPAVAMLVILQGCASYHAATLNTPRYEAVVSSDLDKNEIHVVAKALNSKECKKYLDRDVLRRGYQPIQLYINNNSHTSYTFSTSRVSLSCARPEEVARKVHTSTFGRAAGYSAGALVFLPLVIPAIVDGIKSAHANKALDNDFFLKTARDQTIQPHSYFNKLLFVPLSEYQPVFYISLKNEETQKMEKIKVITNQ